MVRGKPRFAMVTGELDENFSQFTSTAHRQPKNWKNPLFGAECSLTAQLARFYSGD
jgi:hypothetical protein